MTTTQIQIKALDATVAAQVIEIEVLTVKVAKLEVQVSALVEVAKGKDWQLEPALDRTT